jgi:hypothetical protein
MTLLDPYIGISDQTYLDAARWQHGQSTQLWPNDGHAYQWNAKKPNDSTKYGINLQGYSDSKYSQNYRIVMAEGVDKYAWRWLNTYSLDWAVLPVVFVASDLIWRTQEVGVAASRWAHNLQRVSDWYGSKLGKQFRVCKPQVVPDSRSRSDIYNLYQSSKTSEGMTPAQYDQSRYLPWRTAIADYQSHMRNRVNTNLIYAFTHYTGTDTDWDFAAAGGGSYLFVSSFATTHTLPDLATVSDPRQQTLAYAVAHEIGHCFELGHTEQQFADNWQQSIMQAARPPGAILCDYERSRLLNNHPFFK